MRALKSFLVVATFAVSLQAFPLSAFAHGGTTSRVPFEICEGHELGDACRWDNGHGALSIGTCRGVDPALHCVRNQPIVTVPSTEEPIIDAHHAEHHGEPMHTHAGSEVAHVHNDGRSTGRIAPWVVLVVAMFAAATMLLTRKRFGRGTRGSG